MAHLSLIFCPESWVQTGYKVEMSHATSTAVLCVLADCTLAQLPQEPVFPTLVPVWLLQLLNSTVKDPWEAQLLFFCLSFHLQAHESFYQQIVSANVTGGEAFLHESAQAIKNVAWTIFGLRRCDVVVQLAP